MPAKTPLSTCRSAKGIVPSSAKPSQSSRVNAKVNRVLACVEDSLILRLGRLYSGCRNITLLLILVSSGYGFLKPITVMNTAHLATLTQPDSAPSTLANPHIKLIDCPKEQLSTSVFLYNNQPLCVSAE